MLSTTFVLDFLIIRVDITNIEFCLLRIIAIDYQNRVEDWSSIQKIICYYQVKYYAINTLMELLLPNDLCLSPKYNDVPNPGENI